MLLYSENESSNFFFVHFNLSYSRLHKIPTMVYGKLETQMKVLNINVNFS